MAMLSLAGGAMVKATSPLLLDETILALLPSAVYVCNASGEVVRSNQKAAELWGNAHGLCVLDRIAPDHRDHWRACHQRVYNGEQLDWEFDIIDGQGRRRHMETHAVPLSLPDGAVVQLAISQDVTSRRMNEDALRESERRSRELLEALPTAIYTTDAEGRITFYNKAAVEMAGRRPELGVDQWCVTWRLYRPDGTPLPHDECPMAVALREQRPVRGAEAMAERPDGSRVPFTPFPTPLFDADGKMIGAVNMLVDISDRLRADEYAQRLASIVQFSDDAIVSKDLQGIIKTWNAGAQRLFGYTAEEVIGKPVNILIPPDRQDEEPGILQRIRAGERIHHYETVRMRKDGSLIDISLTISPLKNAAGQIIGASKIARDITDHKRDETRRQLLINELNHRVKNTLATVQSVALQTFRGQGGEAPKQFESRLIALSKAHDVLTRESWEGADLRELIDHVIASMCVEPEQRFDIAGPALRITPKMSLSLSMALHELCTNAGKYGALANETGRVRIGWILDDSRQGRCLQIRWEESGGPVVKTPKRKGFGTRLLEQALSRELGAQVVLSFLPTGVVCLIQARLT